MAGGCPDEGGALKACVIVAVWAGVRLAGGAIVMLEPMPLTTVICCEASPTGAPAVPPDISTGSDTCSVATTVR